VEHRLLEMQPPEERVLATIAGMLSAELAGRGMDELSQLSPLVSDADNSMANCSEMSAVRSAIRKMGWDLSQRKIYLEGTHQFLRQPEFHDVQRLEILLNALEQRNALFKVLRRTLIGDDVTIIIGEENAYAPMQDCSVISTSYRIGRRHAGYIGVVGPTRMKYDRAAAAVGLMAKSLSQVLTGLSMA
ncbi:MAG TPA: HrcA family transcriptional regulator, partial [Chthonomonadales bacterium]|nr:HrcA family transcriptional regulator [Chthonomonadales bacterium]